ncbi:MAG: hypothetical protein ABIH82_02675 [Candidatus Woesearchaeota archaeon]
MPRKKVKNLINLWGNETPMRIKYKDIFSLKDFYQFLREYLKVNGWYDEEEGSPSEHWEAYYGERIDQKGAREIWFNWRLAKEPMGSPMIRFYIDIDFHCLGIVSTEVIVEGKKIKANKGEVEMKMWAYVEQKFMGPFEKHWLLKHFAKLFAERIYDKATYQRRKELHQELYTLTSYIKQWFKMKRHLPYEEQKQFYRSWAFPSHKKEE